ncbi:hypothetical protein ACFL12_01005 [Pseudomonadota bacterium]
MAQTFGILGFLFSLLALFFASEVMRRANHRQAQLEANLFKAQARIQQIEGKMHHVERLAADIRHQKKRQAETLTAMTKKGDPKARAHKHDRFTPSSHKKKKTA